MPSWDRQKNAWVGSVMVDGKRRRKFFPTKADAKKWEVEEKGNLQKEISRPATRITSYDWLNQYMEFAKINFGKKTIDEKAYAFQRFFSFWPPENPVEEITPAMAHGFLQGEAVARSGHAANKARKNLVAAWTWGAKYLEGFPAGPNPFATVGKFKSNQAERYVPPEADFWKVYETCGTQDRALLLACLHLAARRGEIFGLHWSDVDWENARIRVWTGKRAGGREFDWLPMTNRLKEALRAWLAEWLKAGPFGHDFIFVNLEGGRGITKEYYGKPFQTRARWLKNKCRRLNIEPFGFHSIRHLSASILYREGVGLEVIQAILRHQSATTTNRYLHSLGIEHVRKALEGVFGEDGKVVDLEEKRKKKNGFTT